MTRYPYPMPWCKDESVARREEVWAVKNAALREIGVPLIPHPVTGRLTCLSIYAEQSTKALGLAFTALGIDFEWVDEPDYIERLVANRRRKKERGEPFGGGGCLISRESWYPPELRRGPVFA